MSETDTPAPAPEAPRFLPINDWAKYFDWPPPGGLRHLRFHAETNGFAPAFKKVGGRVLVDTATFWRIVERGAAQ
ncbi:MAG: hypothetical protein MUC77_17080 [Chromatiaceae bacterium]|jgi:hypothetical protein|nr:hypothetical protein [Chromatiaceae bacterium]